MRVTALMNANLMVHYMFTKYVDDSNLLLENLGPGARWSKKLKKITYNESDARDDQEQGREPDEVTMRAWGAMASSVVSGLVFTVDFPQNHTNRKVPMLDFMVWSEPCDDGQLDDPQQEDDARVVQGQEKDKPPSPLEGDKDWAQRSGKSTIRYEFYEKLVARKMVMMRESAMPQHGPRGG